MKAVTTTGIGGVDVLSIQDIPSPRTGKNQLLVKVCAAALNYADTMQRKGTYKAPPGQTDIMGVEVAGIIEQAGPGVNGFEKGQKVFGLVEGGGYAEYCLMEKELAMKIPKGWSFAEAAAVPEAFCAANETLFELGRLRRGQAVLIHAGGSGVGSAALQMARHAGATVFCTVGADEKAGKAMSLGADAAINYKKKDFAKEIMRLTGQKGVDLVEDFIGGRYFSRNIDVLKPDGCLLLVGLLDGYTCEAELSQIILKRLQIKGTALRNRSLPEKEKVRQRFEERWLPMLTDGKIKPVIHNVYPIEDVASAHREMEAKQNFGKIVLTLD